jgi:PTH1 family peptidyl-tRNA hydrolase
MAVVETGAAEAAISRWPFRRRGGGAGDEAERDARVDALIVGLGNPGSEYARTRHNLGFEVAAELSRRWQLPRARKRYGGLITDGRTGPGGPRVAILLPQTFMNESGSAAGPARGELGVPLDRVVVLHDEIDLPFGEVRSKLGGGVAGHNGLKSLSQGLGGKDFWRVRGGVGRPNTTDPEIVSNYVLSRFREPDEEVQLLIHSAADEVERLLEEISGPETHAGEEMD